MGGTWALTLRFEDSCREAGAWPGLLSQRPLTHASLLFPDRGTLAKKALRERREARWVPAVPSAPPASPAGWAGLPPTPVLGSPVQKGLPALSSPILTHPCGRAFPVGLGSARMPTPRGSDLGRPSVLPGARGQCARGRQALWLVLEGCRGWPRVSPAPST